MARVRSRRAMPRKAGRTAFLRQLRAFLEEDHYREDLTTRSVIPASLRARATLSAQAPGVVSGVSVALLLLKDQGLRARARVKDGDRVRRGTPVLEIEGRARRILEVERTVLNLMTHLSGVASATARAVREARRVSPSFEVAATRKTLPGLRDLEKAAVIHGGGRPHRRDLSSAILLKNNHLALVPLAEAVRRARRAVGENGTVETEVRSLRQAREAARAGSDQLLFDNVSPVTARRWTRALETEGLRRGRLLEVSGGVRPSNIARYAATGVDRASLGALTHSAPALPMHLTVRPGKARRAAPTKH